MVLIYPLILDLRELFFMWAERTPWFQFTSLTNLLYSSKTTARLTSPPSPTSLASSQTNVHRNPEIFPPTLISGYCEMGFKFLELRYLDLEIDISLGVLNPEPYLPATRNHISNINLEDTSLLELGSGRFEFLKHLVFLISNNFDPPGLIEGVVELARDYHSRKFLTHLLKQGLVSMDAVADKLLLPSAQAQNFPLTQALLDSGVNLHDTSKIGDQLLECAIERCNESLVLTLLNRGFNGSKVFPSSHWEGTFLLEKAVWKANFSIVKHLLQHGFVAREKTLVIAVSRDNIDIFDLLASESPWIFEELKRQPWLLFEEAALSGTIAMMEALRMKGFDINATDDLDRGSPLVFAAYRGDDPLVQYLLEAGANINGVMSGIDTLGHSPQLDREAEKSSDRFHPAAIHAAILNGNEDLVRYLLRRGVSPNQPGHMYPIQLATCYGKSEIVQILLEYGADPSSISLSQVEEIDVSDIEKPAILLALRTGDRKLFRVLLESGAKFPNANLCACVDEYRDIDGDTSDGYITYKNTLIEDILMDKRCTCDDEHLWNPLLNAAFGKNKELLTTVLSIGVKENKPWFTHQCLSAFVEHFEWDFVAEHIEKGIFTQEALYQQNVLLAFIKVNNLVMVKRLIKSCRLRDDDTIVGFAYAANLGRENIVRLMLKSGYWPDKGIYKRTYKWIASWGFRGTDIVAPLKEAISTKNKTMIDIMLTHYKNLLDKAQQPAYKIHFLQAYGLFIRYGDFDTVKLMASWLGVNNAEHFGVVYAGCGMRMSQFRSSVQLAIHYKNYDIVEWLLDQGADPNASDEDHHHGIGSPLQCAAMHGNSFIVKILLEKGANVNSGPVEYFGGTALKFAAVNGRFDILDLLLKAGADINAPPAACEGRSAIEVAAESGRLDMVNYLLQAGADIKGKSNKNYKRTVYRAWKHNHFALAHMIQRWKTERYGPEDCEPIGTILQMDLATLLFAGEHTDRLELRYGGYGRCRTCYEGLE